MARAALKRMIDQRAVPHTLLFAGPHGVGKSLFAQWFAGQIMGEEHSAKIASGNHPDLHCYHPEGKSSLHPIESMRQLIEEVGMAPFEAPVKVFLIHDAHQMLPASSNALLKTLEEPTLDSTIILLTDQPELLLPTIVSRCRRVPFFPISDTLISRYLQEQCDKSASEAERIALFSHGSLAKALELATDPSEKKRHLFIELLTCDLQREYPRFLKLCAQLEEALHSTGEEESEAVHRNIESLFDEIFAWYRDLHLLAEGVHTSPLYFPDCEEELRRRMSIPFPSLESVFDQLQTCRLALQRHVKLKTILEHFFLAQSVETLFTEH
jgi:DNA polymerase-3 subunit delta'